MALENTRLEELLPEQLRGTATNLIAFLDNYYTQENLADAPSQLISFINKNQDLDQVTDEKFVDALAQTVAKNISTSSVTERTFLLKRLVDYYNLKGTEKSILIFFQLFYNMIVQIEEPYKKILVPSGSNFQKNESIRIVSSGNDLQDLLGKLIVSKNIFGLITGQAIVDRITKEEYDEDIYTLHFDNGTRSGSFFVKDRIFLGDKQYGTSYRSLAEIKIIDGGRKFQSGDVLFLDNIGQNTFRAKVQNVGPNGEVTKLKIISRGAGNTISFPNGLKDFKYGDEDYQYLIQRGRATFPPAGNLDSPINNLRVQLFFSAIITDGKYGSDQSSQLSSDAVVQDGLYYDKFSYEIRSNITFDRYKELFSQLVHPAGYNVFNKVKIETRPPMSFGERISRTEIKSLESEIFQPGGVYQWKNHPDATPNQSPDYSPTFIPARLGDSPDTSRPDEKIATSSAYSTTRDNYSDQQSPISLSLSNDINLTNDVIGGTDYFMEDFLSSSPAARIITIEGLGQNSSASVTARLFNDSTLNGTYYPSASLSPAIMDITRGPIGPVSSGICQPNSPNNRTLSSTFASPFKTPAGGKVNKRFYWVKEDYNTNCPSVSMIYYSSPRWKLNLIHSSGDHTPSVDVWQTTGSPYFKDIPPTKGWQPHIVSYDHRSITVSGAGTSAVNGVYIPFNYDSGTFSDINPKTGTIVYKKGIYYLLQNQFSNKWFIQTDEDEDNTFYQNESTTDDPPTTGWLDSGEGDAPAPTIAITEPVGYNGNILTLTYGNIVTDEFSNTY